MKKKIVLFLTLSLCIFSLVGCNSDTPSKKNTKEEVSTTISKNEEPKKDLEKVKENANDKKISKETSHLVNVVNKMVDNVEKSIKEFPNKNIEEESTIDETTTTTETSTTTEEPTPSTEPEPVPGPEPTPEEEPTPEPKPIVDEPIFPINPIDPTKPETPEEPIPEIPTPTSPVAPIGHEDNIYTETNYDINISQNINAMNKDIFNKAINKNENIVYSPYSIYVALLGLSNGSYVSNEARQELLEVLDIQKDASYKNIGQKYKEFNKISTKQAMDYKFTVANSVWIDDTIGKNVGEFTSYLTDYFNSETYVQDIQNKGTTDMMNSWVSGKTNGLIKEVVSSTPADALTYLINTVYFKGSWRNEFEERATEKKDFHGTKGTTQVDMMHKSFDKENYFQDEKITSVELDYKGNKFSMRIFIPTDKTQYIGDLIQGYDVTTIPYEVVRTNIQLPKFDIEYTLPASNILKDMGLLKVFGHSKNTFELIDENAFVSNVMHKAKITVDEEGTEAAAATVIEMVGTSYDPNPIIKDFIVDCPFIYTIIDNETNTVIFYGINNNL